MTTVFSSIEADIKNKLAGRSKGRISDPQRVPAAVLIILFEKDGETHVLFTRRTDTVEYHKGQICFPGGCCEGAETKCDTALRESFEEIGVRPDHVEILGELDDIKTQTSIFIISPFVGRINYPYRFNPSSIEINAILELPLDALRDRRNWQVQHRTMDDGAAGEVYYVEVDGAVVWGATAKILKQLIEVVNGAELGIEKLKN